MSVFIEIVAGIIDDDTGKIGVNKRPPDKTFGGYWEFPGGKIEAGETHQKALARELEEELGIIVEVQEFITTLEHDYRSNGGSICKIYFYRCRIIDGIPTPQEKNDFRWVTKEELSKLTENFVPADIPIFSLLS